LTSACRNACQPAARVASVFFGNGIERDAPALGERRPQIYFWDAAIVSRADGRKAGANNCSPTSSGWGQARGRERMSLKRVAVGDVCRTMTPG
jgi:hypothetical protein